MEVLDNKEAMTYVGGGKFSLTVGAIIAGVVAFALGVINGITNPSACKVSR